ncbi:hypothetical protein [Kribbella pratensis]|uniref:Uncharacterized protein n=1 Tax=Kribbella pratensis TaxID=2512112 RepID=A0A4R8BWJ7_9ACTN|nr:hypothetical protein [Kribbella pratensis]TDW66181.1 hypothetical protein EV653_6203 [Kribbella pratensis]
MSEVVIRRYAGLFGVIASALIVVQVPLYFLYSGAPPDWNILTRSLIGIVGCVFYLLFFTGLRQLIHQVDVASDWIAGVIQAAGLLWVAMVFVPQSMEAGAAIVTDHDIDTTKEGPFAGAQYLMQGLISRLLMGLFLIALGIVVYRLRLLPKWVGWSAFVLAAINLAFVPALYFGDNPSNFYAVQGWGTTASMGALWSLWTLAVSISVLHSSRRTAVAARPRPAPVPAVAG